MISAARLIKTKVKEMMSIAPWTTGTSRAKMEAYNCWPIPGQEKITSVNRAPPSKKTRLQTGDAHDGGQPVAQCMSEDNLPFKNSIGPQCGDVVLTDHVQHARTRQTGDHLSLYVNRLPRGDQCWKVLPFRRVKPIALDEYHAI